MSPLTHKDFEARQPARLAHGFYLLARRFRPRSLKRDAIPSKGSNASPSLSALAVAIEQLHSILPLPAQSSRLVRMKKTLRKLPAGKRHELDHAVSILRETFATTVSTRQAPRLRDGKILKIILFGSYARGDWVHDPVGRYFSDFDLLVVVDHEDLTDLEFWEAANERLLAEIATGSQLRTPVTFIVHSLDDVNQKLELGRYFFTDIIRDGVVLFSEPGVSFVKPQPLSPTTALRETEEYYDDWLETAERRVKVAEFSISQSYNSIAAFELHQATEALYIGLMLVLTLHSPKAHNLVHLRRLAEPLVPRLAEVWPHESKFEKRCFELLRAAYVKARYSKHYKITDEELAYLTQRIALLRDIVREACEERLTHLKDAIALQ